MTRTFLRVAAWWSGVALVALVPACSGGRPAAPARPPVEALETAIEPSAAVTAFRRFPGAHFHGTTRFQVRTKDRDAKASAQAVPVAPDEVTTTTDIWMDGRGHFRILETNDRDGGREITFFGQDLTVGLRYLRPVRRPAREPEPSRLLGDALGGPWAAWDTVRRQAVVTRDPKDPQRLLIARAETASNVAGSANSPVRRWRDSVVVHTLKGEARVDGKTGATVAFSLDARFSANRDGTPVEGEIAVTTSVDHIGRVAALNPPDASVLEPRQRTVLEERALLEGLAPVAREKGAR